MKRNLYFVYRDTNIMDENGPFIGRVKKDDRKSINPKTFAQEKVVTSLLVEKVIMTNEKERFHRHR